MRKAYEDVIHKIWKIEFLNYNEKTSQCESPRPIMYLCNHRCFADFVIDSYLTNGAAYLSRMMTIPVVPCSFLLLWLTHGALYFNRGTVKDQNNKLKLYERVLRHLRQQSLIVYPEGTRNLGPQPRPLRWGMIRLAYTGKIPIQIVLSSNKEKVWCERGWIYNTGVKSSVSVSEFCDPNQFESVDDWCKHIECEWKKAWKSLKETKDNTACRIYSVQPPGLDTSRLNCLRGGFLVSLMSSVLFFKK